ncbi:MAG: hypothetical protein FMNOHCHN_01233 [Ignavibacteriaceae bacterium]|nr:hypothetical protein [Ignavibacteriaceae bacterium]
MKEHNLIFSFRSHAVTLSFFFLFLTGITLSQENIFLVTYGPNAPTREGDDDFKQILFLKIPSSLKDSVYLRIFDADIGGGLDSPFDKFDTQTRFALYGGAGVYSDRTIREQSTSPVSLNNGVLIQESIYGSDPFLDNKWFNFAYFSPSRGELIDGYYYFKLVVEGISGNDGNLFDVALSLQDKRNIAPEGSDLLTFTPTLRLPGKGIFAEMKFLVPVYTDELIIKNFDLAGGKVAVETPFRSNLTIVSSGQDQWAESNMTFDQREKGKYSALKFEGGGEIPNDATFHIVTKDNEPVPFILPFAVRKPNRRPIPVELIKTLSDCYTVVFDGSKSTDPDGESLSFFWDFGDGKTGQGTRIAHTYEKFGTYQAELIVSDASGQVGNSSIKNFTVVLNVPPDAEAGKDRIIAPNEVIQLSASDSKDADGQIVRYLWEFSDGTKAEGMNISKSFVKPGIYDVFLRIEDNSDSPCNFDTDQLKIWVNAQPVVDVGSDIIAAVNQEITLNGNKSTDSDGEIAQYTWDFGDGNKGSGLIVNHKYDKPGKYTVTLVVTDNTEVSNNSASDKLVVTVNDQPVAAAGPDITVAAGEVTQFDGGKSVDRDGKLIDFNWTFGDGNTANGQKVTHTYKAPGKYPVILTVRDNSTSISDLHTDTLLVTVNFPPVSKAGPDQYVTKSLVKLDGTGSSDEDGTITAYLWNFGDNTTSSEAAPEKVYTKPGTYKVTLKVTDDTKVSSNSTTDELTITINAKPVADAGPDKISAPGESVSFDGGGSKDSDGSVARYLWNFGDGKSAEGKTVTHVFEKSGTYLVSLKVFDNSGHEEAFDMDEAVITVNAPPVVIPGPDVIAAPLDVITFDAGRSFDRDGKIQTYEWSFSDTSAVFKGAIVKRSFTKPGTYKAALSVVDDGKANNSRQESSLRVVINSEPISKAGTDLVTCDNTVRFDGSGSSDPDGNPLLYIWDFGDGSPADTGLIAYHTYRKPGTYPVILTVNDGLKLKNSIHSSAMTVEINQAPVAEAGPDKVVCSGEIVLFDGSGSYDPDGGLLKYFWDFGDGTTAEGQNPTKIYKDAGTYQITLSVKDDSNLPCNTDIDQMIVTVAEAPTADAGTDQTVCANTIVNFDGSNSKDFDGVVNNFEWDFGDGTTGGGAKPTHVYTKPGVYRVLLTVTGDNVGECDNMGRDELIVTVLAAPVAKMKFEKTAALNAAVIFDGSQSTTATGKIIEYIWDFGDGTTASGINVRKSYNKYGKFFVKLTVKTDANSGCESTSVIDYIIVNNPPVADAGDPVLAGVNDIVVFNGSRSNDVDGSVVFHHWNFADGDTATGLQVRHQFRTGGTYIVKLTVKDNTSLSNNTSQDTLLVVINEAPVPVIDIPEWGGVNKELLFKADRSFDKDGSITSYLWNFGNGNTGNGASVTPVYTKPGSYEVTLTVKDNRDLSNSSKTVSRIIRINHPPFSYAGPDMVVCPDEKITFDGSGSFDQDGTIQKYVWDFGNGSTAEGEKVQYAFNKSGTYTVKLTVHDNSGLPEGRVTDELIVHVNASPIADAGEYTTVYTGGAHDAVMFDGRKSKDPDGGTLQYHWDFGDGNSAIGAVVSHYFSKPGQFKVKLTVKDGSGKVCGESSDERLLNVIKR